MPRVSDSGGVRFRIPAVYEKLLTGGSRNRRRLDPRLELQGDLSQAERHVWTGYVLSLGGKPSRIWPSGSQPVSRSRCRAGTSAVWHPPG